MLTLSRSKLEDAARCRRKFYYKHILELKEQTSSQGASEGTILHAGLAGIFGYIQATQPMLSLDLAYLKATGAKAMVQMINSGTYEYRGETFNLAPGCQEPEVFERLLDVIGYYVDNQLEADMKNAVVVAVEQNFCVPINPYYKLEGLLDLVLLRTLEDGKKIYEVYDHKSVGESAQKDLDFLRLDVQFLVYEWIYNNRLDSLGPYQDPYPVEMVYNVLRRDRPPGYGTRELKRNLNGSVSAKNASQDPKDYLRQERIAHSPEELSYIEAELVELCEQADLLIDDNSPGAYTRSVIKTGGEACTNCPYFTRCASELVGHGAPDWHLKK